MGRCATVKNTCYSCGGLGFSFQNPQDGLPPPTAGILEEPTPFSGLYGRQTLPGAFRYQQTKH